MLPNFFHTQHLTITPWKVLDIKAVNSIVIGMLANLTVLMSSHYVLNQPGGWVGIKDNSDLMRVRKERGNSKSSGRRLNPLIL